MSSRSLIPCLVVVYALLGGPLAAQTVELVDAQGNPPFSFFEGSRAYVRVFDPSASVSVTASVSSVLTGDAETVQLAEVTAGSGLFTGSVLLSIATVGAPVNGDGKLRTSRQGTPPIVTWDTVRATYGSAQDTASTIGSMVGMLDAAGEPLLTFVPGATVYLSVTDYVWSNTPDPDVVFVVLTRASGGEEETVALVETGATTALFTGSIPTIDSSASTPNNGRIEITANANRLEARHPDANGQTYSYSDARTMSGLPITVEWADAEGQPLAGVYEFSTVRIRATDGPKAGWGYLWATVTSDLRGDRAGVSLNEEPGNPGVFSGTIAVPATLSTTPPAHYDSAFEVTELAGPPHQRDTVRVQLDGCSTPPCPADAVPMIGSTIRITDSQWADVARAGSPLHVEVTDFGASPGSPTAVTLVSQEGDSETFGLAPSGTPGIFRGSIVLDQVGAVVPGNGTLEVAPVDTVTATHLDPLGLSSSTDSASVSTGDIEVLDRAGNVVPYFLANGPLQMRVTYPTGNANPGMPEVIMVTIRSKQPNGDLQDTESVAFYESGPDTGVFLGSLQTQMFDWGGSGNYLLSTYGSPDGNNGTVEIALVSSPVVTTAAILPAIVRIVDAAGRDRSHALPGDRLYLEVESYVANYSLGVVVRGLTQGDEELLYLNETGYQSRIFRGELQTYSATTFYTGNQVLETPPDGEVVRVQHAGPYGTATDTVITGDGNPGTPPPIAVDDAVSTPDQTSVTFNVLTNDSAGGGAGGLHVTSFHLESLATLTLSGSGVFTYAPPPNYFTGTDTFTYRVTNADGDSSEATVTVTVYADNEPPIAGDDAYVIDEGAWRVPFQVTANDADPENEPFFVGSRTQGTLGWIDPPEGNTLYYTPVDPNIHGTDTFSYTIADYFGATDTATVQVTIRPVPDPPSAVTDNVTTGEDVSVLADVLANDHDFDGDTLQLTAVFPVFNGTPVIENGKVRFTPPANFSGSGRFRYTVADPGGLTGTGFGNVTITSLPDTPVANADSAATDEETAVTVSVLANDSDADGEALTVSAVTQGAHGSVAVDASQRAVYTPAADFFGSDSFTYTAADPTGRTATATVTVTVANVADAPNAVDDAATTAEDTAASVAVRANDSDADGDGLTVVAVTPGSQGTTAIDAGAVVYTPAADFHGSDSFTYTVDDGTGRTDTATVSVTVGAENDVPVAGDDTASTDEDAPVTVAVLANDSDVDGDDLTVTAVTQGSKGAVTFTAAAVAYTPAADANGADSFTYTVGDGNGGTATATVAVTIGAVNDAPVAAGDSTTTNEDTAVVVAPLANDSDADGDTLAVTAVTQGSKGAVTFTAASVTYTPAANANGADSFTYTVGDGNGGTATATVAVTIAAVNDAPAAAGDGAGTNEDAAVVVAPLANDSDVDGDSLAITAVTQGAKGAVTFTAASITYTPVANANGADAFTYSIADGNGGTATATVTVAIAAVNDPPDAVADAATTNEGSAVVIAVLGNDTDIDSVLSVTSVTTPAHGTATINGNGTVTYTPAATYSGADSFSYTLSDGTATDSATVALSVKDILANVAVLATHGIWLQTGADVLSGDVIVNAAGVAPFLTGSVELTIAGTVTTAAGWDVQANRVSVASGAAVASDAYYNQLTGNVSGAHYTPLALPVFASLPTFQNATPGAADVTVANNGTLTLAAGSYRDLIVGRKGTVTFTGGVYHFRSLIIDREAKLFFAGGSQVRVQQKMSTLATTTIGPAAGSGVTPGGIVFYVGGINGTTGTLAATPKAVDIGPSNTVSANVYAPNGTLWVRDNGTVTGSLIGRDVQVNANGQVSLSSAW